MRRWAGALPLAVALLAGCTDGADDPTILPSASTTASPSPTISPPPSAATPQGAAAFARYWYDVLNKATATGDTKLLRQLSSPDCRSCSRLITSIDAIYAGGGHVRGGGYAIRLAEAPALRAGDAATVTVIYDLPPAEEVTVDGKVVQRFPETRNGEAEIALRRLDRGWVVADLIRFRESG